MLRLARIKKSTFILSGSDEEKIFSQHNTLTTLIKKHLSPVIASIFATPTEMENSDEIEWNSELKGQPLSLSSLPEEEQQQVKKLLHDRISAITRLADKLADNNPDSKQLQPLLKQALHYPGDSAVYVVNGQPVLTFWGIADKTKSTPLPTSHLASPPLPIKQGHKTNKPSRFLAYFGLLGLLAAFIFLCLYWFCTHPINWHDYNPFADDYQPLIEGIKEAGDDCSTLSHLYKNNKSLLNTEEKYRLVKQNLAVKISRCEAYDSLVQAIELAKKNCPELKQILKNNTYLQTPEGRFIKLRQQLESRINECSQYQQLISIIESNVNNCLLLNRINSENAYLQNPQGKFIALKKQLKTRINNCSRKQLETLPKVLGAEFVGGFDIFTPTTKERALKEINLIAQFLSDNKSATVLITLTTVVSGPNYTEPMSYRSGFKTTKQVLDARYKAVVNGLLKLPGVSRQQIKKNIYKYNRKKRMVTFNIKA